MRPNIKHIPTNQDEDFWIPNSEAGRALLLKALTELENKQVELMEKISSDS
jgi:hypothetical protein